VRAEPICVRARTGPARADDWAWLEAAGAARAANDVLRGWSDDAAVVLLVLPPPVPEGGISAGRYAELLSLLCAGLPPTLFCGAGTAQPVITTDI